MRIRMSILHDLCEDDLYVCEYAVACIYIREGEGGLNAETRCSQKKGMLMVSTQIITKKRRTSAINVAAKEYYYGHIKQSSMVRAM